ncbi:MAG: ketoacyl-ACP synthase III [Planctomycetes bacterium]|nr:ketoacyl-ACP synthase III [Planctomycetota bacterium]
MRRAGIVGTGSSVPERILSNEELERMVETSDEWIRTRTGMRERRIAAPGQGASDLAVAAARGALRAAELDADKLELIIVATFTPDRPLPATACYVQRKLGATNAAGFDLSIACTGFINALMTADSLVAGGMFRNALVIGTEVMSSVTDYQDRDSCVLFGDAAGAAVVGADASEGQILDHVVKIDGQGTEMISIPSGGSAAPLTADRLEARENFLRLSGRQVFKFAVNAIGDVVGEILLRNGYTIADVDLFVPHQANLRIIEAAATRLGIDMDRVIVNIDRYGNTSAASVPLALDEAASTGRLKRGDLVCLVAFGAGLSWGATLLRW